MTPNPNPNFITFEQSQELVRLGLLNISMFKYNKRGELVAPFTTGENAFAPWWSDGRHLPAITQDEIISMCYYLFVYTSVSFENDGEIEFGVMELISQLDKSEIIVKIINNYLLAKLPSAQRELILTQISK